jgi:transposase
MARKAKKTAVAHARAFRHTKHHPAADSEPNNAQPAGHDDKDAEDECGYMCIFLPKFHCELNPIEFFWSQVKKYLRDNCDYTFDTLKKNMLLALASVSINMI